MNNRMAEDPFTKNDQGISKFYHEVLLSMKCLQSKLPLKNMVINYYDILYTVIKNRKDKANVEKQDIINVDESDFNIYNVFIVPDHYVGRKNDKKIIR